jgi:hypothetical protein
MPSLFWMGRDLARAIARNARIAAELDRLLRRGDGPA